MEFIRPDTGAREIELAKDQPQYKPITVAIYMNSNYPGSTMMLARVRLNEEERQRIFFGCEDLFISEIIFPNAEGRLGFTPLDVQVGMQHYKIDKPIAENQGDGS